MLSATITPCVEQLLETKLAMHANQVKLWARFNWLNISYVSLDIVNCLSNFKNLEFLVPDMYHVLMILQKTMVFFDTQNMAQDTS